MRGDISRTPVTYVELILDYCGRVFGISPCNATGEACYNTFPTCKYKSAYLKQSKVYAFSSSNAGLPFKEGERPYIKSIRYLPTEIKSNLTVSGRVAIEFFDEPDGDVGIDPYLSTRSYQPQGLFWRKLIARNRNYKNRLVKIYEGFLGETKENYQQKWVGLIENITISQGIVKVETKDLLKKISDVKIPKVVDIKLVVDIDVNATVITLSDVTDLTAPGYIIIGEEIIYYTGINQSTRQITGCTRGYFNTTPAEHKANDKVGLVRRYSPINPFDLLLSILQEAGIDSDYIDTDAFDYWKNYPGGEINFSAVITEPTPADKLYFEIVDLLDCKSWVGEDLKITIRRNMPNEPDRQYVYLDDAKNIVFDSVNIDANEKSRITRVLLYWDKTTLGKLDDITAYNRLDIAIDADAESTNEYGDVIEKKFFCRWLRSADLQEEVVALYIRNFLARHLFRQRDAQPILVMDLEIKDDVKTGSYCKVSTDEFCYFSGEPFVRKNYQVVKREVKGAVIGVHLLKMSDELICFIAPNDIPDYDNASDAQREYGFISDSNGLINDKPGYYIY